MSKKPTNAKKDPSGKARSDALNPMSFEPSKITDADLEDELFQLTGVRVTKEDRVAAAPTAMSEADLARVLGQAQRAMQAVDDDADIPVTEGDLNDQSLLGELAEIMGGSISDTEAMLEQAKARKAAYAAAITAFKENDKPTAIKFMKLHRSAEEAIKKLEAGESFDMSLLPEVAAISISSTHASPQKSVQASPPPVKSTPAGSAAPTSKPASQTIAAPAADMAGMSPEVAALLAATQKMAAIESSDEEEYHDPETPPPAAPKSAGVSTPSVSPPKPSHAPTPAPAAPASAPVLTLSPTPAPTKSAPAVANPAATKAQAADIPGVSPDIAAMLANAQQMAGLESSDEEEYNEEEIEEEHDEHLLIQLDASSPAVTKKSPPVNTAQIQQKLLGAKQLHASYEAAVEAAARTNKAKAKELLVIRKSLESIIERLEGNENVAASEFPPPPPTNVTEAPSPAAPPPVSPPASKASAVPATPANLNLDHLIEEDGAMDDILDAAGIEVIKASPNSSKVQKQAGGPKSPPSSSSSPSKVDLRVPEEPLARQPSDGLNVSEDVLRVEHLRLEYRAAALKFKKENDVKQALYCAKVSKHLDTVIDGLKAGKNIDLSQLPASLSNQPSPADIKARVEVFEKIVETLKAQEIECKEIRQMYLGAKNLEMAKKMDAYAKKFAQDIDTVRALRVQNANPPPFTHQEFELQIERVFSHLGDNEGEIEVVRCINLPVPKGWTDKNLSPYIKVNASALSDENPEWQTDTVKDGGQNPEFKSGLFKFTFKRMRLRSNANKIITFQCFVARLFGGLFGKEPRIGQAEVLTTEFLKSSEIHTTVSWLDDARKPTGGDLEVKLRIREPLNGKDLQSRAIRWLVLQVNPSHDITTSQRATMVANVETMVSNVTSKAKAPQAAAGKRPAGGAAVGQRPTGAAAAGQQPTGAAAGQRPIGAASPGSAAKGSLKIPEPSEIESLEVISALLGDQGKKMAPYLGSASQAPEIAPEMAKLTALNKRRKALEEALGKGDPKEIIPAYIKRVGHDVETFKALAIAAKAANQLPLAKKAYDCMKIASQDAANLSSMLSSLP